MGAKQTVFNSIAVYTGLKQKRFILVKSDFFKAGEDYIIKVYDDSITFERPTIDYQGVSFTAGKTHNYWIRFNITNDILPLFKTKEFDEEDSNEDIMVAYY